MLILLSNYVSCSDLHLKPLLLLHIDIIIVVPELVHESTLDDFAPSTYFVDTLIIQVAEAFQAVLHNRLPSVHFNYLCRRGGGGARSFITHYTL